MSISAISQLLTFKDRFLGSSFSGSPICLKAWIYLEQKNSWAKKFLHPKIFGPRNFLPKIYFTQILFVKFWTNVFLWSNLFLMQSFFFDPKYFFWSIYLSKIFSDQNFVCTKIWFWCKINWDAKLILTIIFLESIVCFGPNTKLIYWNRSYLILIWIVWLPAG